MNVIPNALGTALFGALILFALYRRFRRNFGRQRIERRRMTTRIAILTVLAIFLLSATHQDVRVLGACASGLVLGAALAVVGLRLTHFERTPEGEFYTPNTYIGAILSAVLLGRLLYRFVAIAPAMHLAEQQAPDPNALAALNRSPLTLGIFMVVVGYYVIYFAGLLWRARTT
jgi:hypothetical protein